MILSQRKQRRAAREQFLAAQQELLELHDELRRAYNRFNCAGDPGLVEASILEIGALQSKYGCALRTIKAMNGDMIHGCSSDSRHPAGRGDRSDRAAAEAAAQTYQMGV